MPYRPKSPNDWTHRDVLTALAVAALVIAGLAAAGFAVVAAQFEMRTMETTGEAR